MKKTIFVMLTTILASCDDGEIDNTVVYSNDIYDLKEYMVERHPPIVRNGFAMDIYHEGSSQFDVMYIHSETLPAWHPNNPAATGEVLMQKDSLGEQELKYDLLFYNEFVYTRNNTGDYFAKGYPVVFMYTDPNDENNTTKAAMVGQGIECFNSFTTDSIARYVDSLRADTVINLPSLRTELHNNTVDGTILLRTSVSSLYASLVIGNKFRPGIGGIITGMNADDEAQINVQPVFLVKTREGLYAKFMVTRFKHVGLDIQKLALQWQALETD